MVGVKGKSGGKRVGAGRPRKGVAKSPPPRTIERQTAGKPILVSRQSQQEKAEKRLGFRDLKKKLGVTVLSEARHQPVLTRMIRVGEKWVPEASPILFGAKATHQPYYDYTDADTENYYGMHKYYREFRRDDLVHDCIVALAYYSTCKRFETVIEPTQDMSPEEAQAFIDQPQFKQVKDRIDQLNKQVHMDDVLFTAVINAKTFGAAAFEIVKKRGGRAIDNLLPLESRADYFWPNVDNDWNLIGYHYANTDNFYQPEEILYFPNLALKGDRKGISEIESIIDIVEARRAILKEALPEAAKVLWAGIGYISVNTEGMTDADAAALLNDLEAGFTPGRWNFGNHKIEVNVADLKPNLIQLNHTLDTLEKREIGHFHVPGFLIGREEEANRATAYAKLETFISGPVGKIQQDLSRWIERQWYDPLVRTFLKTPESEVPPIEIKHQWNKFSTADFTTLLDSLSNAAGQGWMPQEKAWELAGFDPNELAELKKQNLAPHVQSQPSPTKEEALTNIEMTIGKSPIVDLTEPEKASEKPKGRFVSRSDGFVENR